MISYTIRALFTLFLHIRRDLRTFVVMQEMLRLQRFVSQKNVNLGLRANKNRICSPVQRHRNVKNRRRTSVRLFSFRTHCFLSKVAYFGKLCSFVFHVGRLEAFSTLFTCNIFTCALIQTSVHSLGFCDALSR